MIGESNGKDHISAAEDEGGTEGEAADGGGGSDSHERVDIVGHCHIDAYRSRKARGPARGKGIGDVGDDECKIGDDSACGEDVVEGDLVTH